MAEIEIRLEIDSKTNKKNVIISYTSDTDALPMEHEEAHRAHVDRLIAGGALSAAELGKIVVERKEEDAISVDHASAEDCAQTQRSVEQKN